MTMTPGATLRACSEWGGLVGGYELSLYNQRRRELF